MVSYLYILLKDFYIYDTIIISPSKINFSCISKNLWEFLKISPIIFTKYRESIEMLGCSE